MNKTNGTSTARMAGVLMPIASLPSGDGVGTFGAQAYKFVDILAEMGMKIWQLLPLNPLGYGNSPYQPYSSYAGDELYIDLDMLADQGYRKGGRAPYAGAPDGRIDYQAVRAYKEAYLREACQVFYANNWQDPDFLKFREMEWVYPYAVFIALKKQNGLRCWNEWPLEQQNWILDKQYDLTHLQEEIRYQMFLQYAFYCQWMALKRYANEKGIRIMGDVPFYVGIDSLDVWSSREDFLLDEQWRPSFVAGVPPDYFSATGQRWGNPIYNWENLEKKGFTFWVNRLKYSSELYDIIRIDHFRAFDTYWKIVASCETAVDGEWVEAPGYAMFDELYRQIPDIQIVAEDLGDIRPEVLELRDHYGLMGMNVAEYSLPNTEQTQEDQLIYTGTHDNQTVKGWYQSMRGKEKANIRKKLAKYGPPRESISRKMLRFVYGSKSKLAIVPVADILGLDDRARLNAPGSVGSPNWEWRLMDFRRLRSRIPWVRQLLEQSGRI